MKTLMYCAVVVAVLAVAGLFMVPDAYSSARLTDNSQDVSGTEYFNSYTDFNISGVGVQPGDSGKWQFMFTSPLDFGVRSLEPGGTNFLAGTRFLFAWEMTASTTPVPNPGFTLEGYYEIGDFFIMDLETTNGFSVANLDSVLMANIPNAKAWGSMASFDAKDSFGTGTLSGKLAGAAWAGAGPKGPSVPEPATVVMLGMAAAALALKRRMSRA